jgi:drug/metabolite transporter (DMT)-like permease
MKTALAVVLALLASFCFALGSLLQQSAARQTHARALRLSLLVALLRERRWLAGIILLSHSSVVLAEDERETVPAKTDAKTET